MPPIPGSGLAKGLAVTLRTMTQQIGHRAVPGRPARTPAPHPRRHRRCSRRTARSACCAPASAPTGASTSTPTRRRCPPAAPGGRERSRNVLDRFAIDFSLCMYCGICIEVCPFDALFWSPEFEYAETDIRDLTHERDKLREWMWTVPGAARARPGGRGAQGDRRRPQGGGEARRPAAGRKQAEQAAAGSRPAGPPESAGERRDPRSHRGQPPRLPVPDRRRDRLRPRRPRHPRRGPRHRHHPAAGARRPLAGRRARRPRRRVPAAHRRVHRLGAGADLRRLRRRPPALRADAHQGAHRPLPGRRLRQPLGRPRGRRRRRGRPGLGRRRRLPHHLDRPGRRRPRAPPRSPARASSGTGCCPSRPSPCCCSPPWSARSSCPAGQDDATART